MTVTDLWQLDLQYIPQDELKKGKDIMGAVWTNLEYKVKINDEEMEYPKSKTVF
jgi:hypothetical protein